MRIFLLAFTMLCNFSWSKAQLSTNAILERTIEEIKALKSISYTESSINENPFSKGDISKRKKEVLIKFNSGLIDYKLEKVFDEKGNQVYKEIYSEGKLYTFSMSDSTYSLDKSKEINNNLHHLAKKLKESLQKNPANIIRKSDTVYNKLACYNFLIKAYDVVSNGQHDFTYRYLLINKKSFLPVNFKEKGEGTASKGGYTVGRIFINNEDAYSNIKVNPKIIPNPVSLTGFTPKNTEMLSIGDDSPKLKIKKLTGEFLDESLLENKILLVVFGSIDCPANPLANPVLNRLYAKYKDENFAILDIFTSETTDQVKKYAEANNLQFSTYVATKKQHSEFKIISTPNFYIIGADRKIKVAIEGYSDKLEDKLTKVIDEQVANR